MDDGYFTHPIIYTLKRVSALHSIITVNFGCQKRQYERRHLLVGRGLDFSPSAQDGIHPLAIFDTIEKKEYLNAHKCYKHEDRITVDGRECAT